jgi:hypothetical protein
MVDIVVVSRTQSLEMLAVYSTARAAFTQVLEVPAKMATVVVARVYLNVGKGMAAREIGDEIWSYLYRKVLLVLPLIVIGTGAAGIFLLPALLPKYRDSVPVLVLLLPGIFFTPQVLVVRNLWLAQRRLDRLAIVNVLQLGVIAAALAAATTRFPGSLPAVAGAVLVGAGVNALLLCLTVGRELLGLRRAVMFWGMLAGCATASTLILLALERISK